MIKDKKDTYYTEPLNEWFELSYASFITLPRLVCEAMPHSWQTVMKFLLEQLDDTFDWRPKEGRYWVKLKDARGRYTNAPLGDYRHGKNEVEKIRIKKCPHCGR